MERQRLIDANKLREEIEDFPATTNSEPLIQIVSIFRDKILRMIDDQPTVEPPEKAIVKVEIDNDMMLMFAKDIEKYMEKGVIESGD